MGRYYFGDIKGKLWFAVQDSDDASNFGVQPDCLLAYYVCGCIYQDKEDYCQKCYGSFEEHMEAIKKDDWSLVYDGVCFGEDESYLHYTFTTKHIEFVEETLEQIFTKLAIEHKFDWDKLDFKIVGNEYIANWSVDNIEGDAKVFEELLARWCLGKHILSYLYKNDKCRFACET